MVVTFGLKAQKTADHVPTEKALLWKIDGNEMETPSYLFGTIHMIGKDDYILRESVKTALDNSSMITFEINMDDMTDMSAMLPLVMKMFMKNDTTLQDLLSEEDYQVVTDHFKKSALPLPMSFLEKMKPMFLTMLDPEAMGSFDMGDDGEIVSYEMELYALAQEQEKEIGGLETAEYQMSVFDKIPYQVQADMLVQGIKSGHDTTSMDQLQQMVQMYKDQDIQGMQEMMDDETLGVKGYEDVLLVDRNRNWIPVMGEMMGKKQVFFAVGAGHLGGEEGVIALLRDAGYKVTPVMD
ncbi:MAG: TraB/GumN family protein [Bacteroidetes bacterium]|nr:MAG: TraB/GumN family protein [Bacteroidota bacterium]